jgi:hypothetical protein
MRRERTYSRFWRSAVFILAICSVASAKDKQPKHYPEHGTIISTRTSEQTETDAVRTDYNGKIHGGGSDVSYLPVYRIETETRFYELEARSERRVFSVGDAVQFRIDKQWAFVQQGDKEKKLRVIGVELKSAKQ